MSKTTQDSAPDVRQLRQEELPQAPFPGGKKQAFRVFFEAEVHKQIWKHSTEDVSVEICGVLVGNWARDVDGPYALVSQSIRGEAATNKFAEVTFTHATWAKINQEMDTRFASLKIVGWYHSHPGFGIFLSDRDRFIQDHFFSGPGQLAYVVDPLRKTEGVFRWQEGKPTLAPYFWVGDQIRVATAAGDEPAPDPKDGPSMAAEKTSTTRSGTKESGSWLSLAAQLAMFVAVFLLGYVLAGRLTEWDRLRIEQGALARSLVYLKIRPGLREELETVSQDLDDLAKRAHLLAREHVKLLPEPKETEAAWREIFARLDHDNRLIKDTQAKYGLSPQENAILQALGEIAKSSAESAGSVEKKENPTEGKKK
jgi:proteasome lid subunit RPN8/RPN11